jgi:hypothetical protein
VSPEERNAIGGLSREDLGRMIRDIPAVIVVVLALFGFVVLLFTLEPPA